MSKRWYILNVHSGFEQKVKEYIEEKAKSSNLDAFIENIFIPKEKVTSVKNGKKTESEKKFFPGYMLLKMEMNSDIWHLICQAPKVSGFLGTQKKPSPVPNHEAESIIQQVKEGVQKISSNIVFEIGETVEVIDGPFASFKGNVDDVDTEKERLKVVVEIFERNTPVDLDFNQVKKID